MINLRVNLGMGPSNQSSWKNEPCSVSFNNHVCNFQEGTWENINFSSYPRHVTPQIDCLGKMSPVLRFQHTYMGIPRRWKGKGSFLE